jgi:hypothetical protein
MSALVGRLTLIAAGGLSKRLARREKMTGLARSVISNVVDIRDPIQVARDQLARRAEAMLV